MVELIFIIYFATCRNEVKHVKMCAILNELQRGGAEASRCRQDRVEILKMKNETVRSHWTCYFGPGPLYFGPGSFHFGPEPV